MGFNSDHPPFEKEPRWRHLPPVTRSFTVTSNVHLPTKKLLDKCVVDILAGVRSDVLWGGSKRLKSKWALQRLEPLSQCLDFLPRVFILLLVDTTPPALWSCSESIGTTGSSPSSVFTGPGSGGLRVSRVQRSPTPVVCSISKLAKLFILFFTLHVRHLASTIVV